MGFQLRIKNRTRKLVGRHRAKGEMAKRTRRYGIARGGRVPGLRYLEAQAGHPWVSEGRPRFAMSLLEGG